MVDVKNETKKFSAEIDKVLKLMIHSLYTNNDIFLRELISNASDACDKLRYISQTNDEILSGDPLMKITVEINKEANKLIVSDNGIGMSKEELEDNLGTIAKSGTQQFLSQLTGDAKADNMLIGQFGVGFYSAYMVADYVEVISTKAGSQETYIWSSKGEGEYTIGKSDEEVARGTKIILHVKPGSDNYLDQFYIKNIIKSYSDHIATPIYFVEQNGSQVQVNSSSALWSRSKSEIDEDQYNEFYRSVSYAADKPWLTLHNKNEGVVEFTNLLYVPSTRTFDLFHPDRKRRVKLYIKRVFITDENIDIIPHYLRFLRGVVDSEDLPLNISRETLQYNSTMDKIKNAITKMVLAELKKKLLDNKEQYQIFWNNFGSAIKEGLCENLTHADKLLEICLFYSHQQDKLISLDEYIANMKPDQKHIYYLSGDDIDKLKNSPQLEGFANKNIDVLLFTDSVDDFWVTTNHTYKEKEIKSITRSNIDLDELNEDQSKKDDKKESQDNNIYDELLSYCKEILKDQAKDVIISKKLSSSPACLTVDENSIDIRMERFLIDQKQLNKRSLKILELNTKHPVIENIMQNLHNDQRKEENKNLLQSLFDIACLIEGEEIKDPAGFSKRMMDYIMNK
ncbi:MAG: molecular chaperone HtpG [Rickettsiaceae bacterium]|nr:molecular chaperone HtpG [Rickettsiaceae bacterium]